MDAGDLSKLSTPELLALSREVLNELRSRGVLRTANAPAGDYAEFLVHKAYGGDLAANSEKSWDLRTADGARVQVKCRVVSRERGTMLFSPFRSFDFDIAVFVLLSKDTMSIVGAAQIPMDGVRRAATFRPHVNGHTLNTTVVRRAAEFGGSDVTERLREAAST